MTPPPPFPSPDCDLRSRIGISCCMISTPRERACHSVIDTCAPHGESSAPHGEHSKKPSVLSHLLGPTGLRVCLEDDRVLEAKAERVAARLRVRAALGVRDGVAEG